MGIERALTLYPRNSTTVDTGAAVDVRVLDDANAGVDDISQSCQATHTQDNAERTFDPATGGVTTVADCRTLQKKGYALRLAEDMTPADDTNCDALLPAGSAVVSMTVAVNHSASGIDPGGLQQPNWRASLWRYNPSTDTGTLIDEGATDVANTWQTAAIGNEDNVFKVSTVPLSWAADVIFAAGEVLLLQLGFNTGTLTNPTTGTTTYNFFLAIDKNTATKIVFSTAGISQRCQFAYTSGLDLAATASTRSSRFRSYATVLDLAGAYADLLTLKRSAVAALDLGGAYADLLTLKRAVVATLDLDAVRQAWTIRLRNSGLVAALDLNAAKSFLHRRAFAAGIDLDAAYSRVLTGYLAFAAGLDLNAAYSRIVRVRRTVTGTLDLGAELFVKISQTILNRMVSGGSTIVRKVLYLFDD